MTTVFIAAQSGAAGGGGMSMLIMMAVSYTDLTLPTILRV